MNRNVPKLRFKGFDNEWKEKKLGQITKLTDGVHFTPEYVESGVPFWSVETLASGAKPKFITKQAHDLAIKRCHPQLNDILITRIGTLAKSKVITTNNELSIYVSVALIKASKEFNSKFMKQYFDSNFYYKEFLSKSLLTATPKKINMEDLKGTRVNIPSLQEQEKIANFLTKVDSLIEEQDGKVQDLGLYKKGMMQKIFSQEIRFKEDNGCEYPEWEEKKLGEIISKATLGGNYENTDVITQYPLIKMGNIDRGIINLKKIEYIPKNINIDPKDKLKIGDLLFNTRNTLDLVGKVAIWRDELETAYYNSNLLRIEFKKCIIASNFFMNYAFNSYHILSQLKAIATGTTSVAAIYGRDLNVVKFNIPCLEEQTKIANFLSNIDLIIEQEKNKLEDLRRLKKGLLQQMFV